MVIVKLEALKFVLVLILQVRRASRILENRQEGKPHTDPLKTEKKSTIFFLYIINCIVQRVHVN